MRRRHSPHPSARVSVGVGALALVSVFTRAVSALTVADCAYRGFKPTECARTNCDALRAKTSTSTSALYDDCVECCAGEDVASTTVSAPMFQRARVRVCS
jgi:hypothetical protein